MQNDRYLRNIKLTELGEYGQEVLFKAKALVVGAGGLGCSALYGLACAGIGNIHLLDHDVIELSNLNRQFAYTPSDLTKLKASTIVQKLTQFAPDLKISFDAVKVTDEWLDQYLSIYDVVLDCCDNFFATYMIGDACVKHKKKFITVSAVAWRGQGYAVLPDSPCHRCLLPECPEESDAPRSADYGILGAVAHTFGSWQATEAIKALLDLDKEQGTRLTSYDAKIGRWKTMTRSYSQQCKFHQSVIHK